MKKTLSRHCNHATQNGFSLLEVIVAIAISSLITMLLGELIIQGYKNYRVTTDQTTHTAIARRAQDTMVKELREATPSDRGDYPLLTTAQNELAFYADIDRDSARERIRYWRDGDTIKKGITEPTGDPPKYNDKDEITNVIARYVIGDSPLFRYYDKNEVELTAPVDTTSVTLVGINFTIDVAPGILPRATDVHAVVQLRNIKANLAQ